jgi:hypothetical protein
MEGKYTKLGAIVGILGLAVTTWQIFPKHSKKIDGEWIMTNKVKEADLKQYIGMEVKWKLYITESENKVKGTAEKVAVNNDDLDYSLRTTLEIEGNIKDDKMNLNYVENGKIRKTSGIFIATINGNEFSGQFSQTASNTKGDIKGIKLNE